ncbi:hypothetical protein BL250_08605 [Erwinia sp. OLTSP20]|uniref:YbjO family protein n=1 Tax=unclassified Erwinia TaxID=2622719 RepID=UPI000C181B77|nr:MULTISPECIES: YbjO family protein [unclassified Erwinia]PIJ51286.1 hypothetical protein BV501_04435 [Erwinia sp. OAMSP11]PIJ74071.1 hypothetical protein BK416_04725 [Erwinia sp. OLSSP12]PIJ81177.1 hypothetical protein BLD47_09570 [Erwinia sp. OLCASP19]PIJ86034.1 hypothetical protein BLD46_04520 [Erwinia sp. OLMTSP26]PIJ87783.1 hypothetical protein BLD49_04520 [Erwinia sp. OLMDSP33]
MSDIFRGPPVTTGQSGSAPVAVLVTGIAIIAIRLLDVLLLSSELGLQELMNFVHRSAQAWDSTLIFIGSQLLFFFELRCAFGIIQGRNWARWGYVFSQIIALSYLFVASMGWVYPEIFSISGENNTQIIHRLIAQKFPDLLLILLLFLPGSSRQFFRQA